MAESMVVSTSRFDSVILSLTVADVIETEIWSALVRDVPPRLARSIVVVSPPVSTTVAVALLIVRLSEIESEIVVPLSVPLTLSVPSVVAPSSTHAV